MHFHSKVFWTTVSELLGDGACKTENLKQVKFIAIMAKNVSDYWELQFTLNDHHYIEFLVREKVNSDQWGKAQIVMGRLKTKQAIPGFETSIRGYYK